MCLPLIIRALVPVRPRYCYLVSLHLFLILLHFLVITCDAFLKQHSFHFLYPWKCEKQIGKKNKMNLRQGRYSGKLMILMNKTGKALRPFPSSLQNECLCSSSCCFINFLPAASSISLLLITKKMIASKKTKERRGVRRQTWQVNETKLSN